MPHFWLGLLLIIWFAVDLHWLPATGSVTDSSPDREPAAHGAARASCSVQGFAAALMRQTRSAMLTALGSDYVRTARAKGLSEWGVVGNHALRNSLITVTTLVGLDFGCSSRARW